MNDLPNLKDYCEAACLKLWGKPAHTTSRELRWNGGDAYSAKTFDRQEKVWYDHGAQRSGSTLELVAYWKNQPKHELRGAAFFEEWRAAHEMGLVPEPPPDKPNGKGNGAWPPIRATYPYQDENGQLLFEVIRFDTEDRDNRFRQRRPDGNGGWTWKTKGVRQVLYRLPELIDATKAKRRIYLCEGERDANTAVSLGCAATTMPGGAGKWRSEYNHFFQGADVVVVSDNDESGRDHAARVAKHLHKVAARMRAVVFPQKDPTAWKEACGTRAALDALVEAAPDHEPPPPPEPAEPPPPGRLVGLILPPLPDGLSLDDFWAYMLQHNYIFVETGELWPGSSVDARVPAVPLLDEQGRPVIVRGEPAMIPATMWLAKNKPVDQMTWSPGDPQLIRDRLVTKGGWIERRGEAVFNQYRPPRLKLCDPAKAQRWVDHVHCVYPDDADAIIKRLAHRVQRPGEKINHALVLGGSPGIGKDSLLAPVRQAIGPWNFEEVSPLQLLGRFNGFLKSVILRVSEARDLGDIDRYDLYEHLKAYTAAPPEVLRVDEKNIREHYIWNVVFVVITTNHKTDGIYLAGDDRRHYVAWSERTKESFAADYWTGLWGYYQDGGFGHVAAYLADLDLGDFEPKAPPPKTEAFWAIVNAGRAPEDAEMADALDALKQPDAVTLRT
jgi:hypothetical protein